MYHVSCTFVLSYAKDGGLFRYGLWVVRGEEGPFSVNDGALVTTFLERDKMR